MCVQSAFSSKSEGHIARHKCACLRVCWFVSD
jgi:hypothetical protein